MLGQICFHLGKLYIPYYETKSFGIKVFEYNADEENSPCLFKNTKTYKAVGITDVSNCSVTSVFSIQTKLKIVILVVQFKSRKIGIYTRSQLLGESNLIEIKCFNYDIDPTNLHRSIFVIDGPTVIALENKRVLISSLMFNTSETYDLTCRIQENTKINFLNCIVYRTYNNVYYILVLECSNISSKNINMFAVIEMSDSGTFNKEIRKLSVNYFFPPYYETLVTAIYIFFDVNNSLQHEEHCDDIDSIFSKNHSILCTNQQFLIFQYGLLKYSCNINISDICRITSISRLYSFESNSFFLQSSVNGILLMKMNENIDMYECTETWEDAVFACIGDFVNNCNRQVLILNNIQFDSWQDNICMLYYPSLNPMVLSSDEEPSEHVETTLTSLQNRVIYGQAAIAEAECKIAEKSSIISSILKGLRHQCAERYLPGQNPGNSLVDIMLYKDQAPQICEDTSSAAQALCLQVSKQWQFILDCHWFVGWTFRNVSDNCVSNLRGSLMVQECDVEYKQRTFIENSSDFALQKTDRQHSFPGEEMSVVICLEIPTFVNESFNADCIVMWDIGVSSNPVCNMLPPSDVKRPCQQQSFKISLCVSDIFGNDSFEKSSVKHQLVSLRTIQDSIFIEITSKDSSLSDLENQALKNQKMCLPKILKFEDTKCMFFNNKSSAFFSVNMAWDQQSRNKIEAEIYTKSEKQFVLFIQWLYNILPSDISILAKEFRNQKYLQLQRQVLVALKEEVDLLRLIATTSKRSSSEDNDSYVTVDLNLNDDGDPNLPPTTDIRKAIMIKELTTDHLMKEYLTANYEE